MLHFAQVTEEEMKRFFMYFEISYLNYVTVVDEQTNNDVTSFKT